jgi:hypothetical protein
MSKPKMRVKREKAVKAPPDKAVAKESAGKDEKDDPVVKGKAAPEANAQSPQEQWSDWIWSEERGLYYRARKSSPGTSYLPNSILHLRAPHVLNVSSLR